jgi:hypothetical protein
MLWSLESTIFSERGLKKRYHALIPYAGKDGSGIRGWGGDTFCLLFFGVAEAVPLGLIFLFSRNP